MEASESTANAATTGSVFVDNFTYPSTTIPTYQISYPQFMGQKITIRKCRNGWIVDEDYVFTSLDKLNANIAKELKLETK